LCTISVLQIHGTSDIVVSYNGGGAGGKGAMDVVNYWVTKNNCPNNGTTTSLPNTSTIDMSTVDKIEYTPCATNTEVQLLKINSGGHTWPNASGLSGIGTVNMDIDASTEIWNFFNKHTNPNVISTYNKNLVSISPNPCNGFFTLNIDKLQHINLYNNLGQLVRQYLPQAQYNVQHIPPGLYQVIVVATNAQYTSKLFIE
jgi:hypothetical protein